ncbi:Uncharacterized protein PECH_002173 [Penicillium ucsense]|uniref:Uncharacterized protein n=1 Tax=Penicillium ucsense TaxID=2839758 RepID=A0A8J8WHJ2_9EURO|nr:Uncharacterized protein PECM_001693 [Penicillium ucsense]KAF7731177.1 Uncharacterized protein PECH_002173 [Penicillium ucsense]
MPGRQTRSMTAAALKKANTGAKVGKDTPKKTRVKKLQTKKVPTKKAPTKKVPTKKVPPKKVPTKRGGLNKPDAIANTQLNGKAENADAPKENEKPEIQPQAALPRVLVAPKSPEKATPLQPTEDRHPASELPLTGPKISFGLIAAYPRWITCIDNQEPGRDLEKDLIRTHPGQTVIPGIPPGIPVRAYDPNAGLAGLKWVFEPGPTSAWGGLTRQELESWANDELAKALRCPSTSYELQIMCREQHGSAVANVANPLPPAPRRDTENPVTQGRVVEQIRSVASQFLELSHSPIEDTIFDRPQLGWRPHEEELPQEETKYTQLFSMMKRNMKGTLGHPDHQDQSLDPVPRPVLRDTPAQTFGNSLGISELAAVGSAIGSDVRKTKQNVDEFPGFELTQPGANDAAAPKDHSEISTEEPQALLATNFNPEPKLPEIQVQVRPADKFPQMRDIQQQVALQGNSEGLIQENTQEPNRQPKHDSAKSHTVNELAKILGGDGQKRDEASEYFQMCTEIVENDAARQRHFPSTENFRQIRSWAGARMPAEVSATVCVKYSQFPTTTRPFAALRMKALNDRVKKRKRTARIFKNHSPYGFIAGKDL